MVVVAVNGEEHADVLGGETANLADSALAHSSIGEKALLLLDGKETLLDSVADDEALNGHLLGLADAVGTVNGLVLGGRVPL